MGTESKKILVIQTAFLGDVVLTTPLLQAVRVAFPQCYLAVLIIPGTRTILEDHPAIDEIFVFDKKGHDAGLKGLLQISHRLREKQFDWALLPHRSFRSALLTWLAAIPVRIGYWQTAGALLYSRRVWRYPVQHEVDRCLALLQALEVEPPKTTFPPTLEVTPQEKTEVRAMLVDLGVRPEDRVVGISPGSVWATKRWIEEGFTVVADHLANRNGVKVLLLGSPDDREVSARIVKQCQRQIIDFTGHTSLRQLAAILSYCSVLLTNDNGAMHVGEAVGTPIVAIFGSTTLNLGYGPRDPGAIVLEHSFPCRPCGRHGHRHCPQGHFRCMREITAEEVIAAVDKQLKQA